jgi:hypothetical protein
MSLHELYKNTISWDYAFKKQKQYLQNPYPLLRSQGGYLPMDAAQIFLFVPIPAKAKKLGLLSIYKFSLRSPIENFEEAFLLRQIFSMVLSLNGLTS